MLSFPAMPLHTYAMPPSLLSLPPSLSVLVHLVLAGIALYMVRFVAGCVYLLFFHPLAKYPGPKLAAVSESWLYRRMMGGRGCFELRDAHRKYGDVIRTGPNQLSFSTPQAYKDIYGHVKHGEQRFLKNKFYQMGEERITRIRDPVVHAQQRKTLAWAFSAQALLDQETVVQEYVDQFLRLLAERGQNGREPVNATDALNWLTFDVIGELAFGEPFNTLSEASNAWIELIFAWTRHSMVQRRAKKLGRLLGPLYLRWFCSQPLAEAARKHETLSLAKAQRRLAKGDTGRVDFFGHLIKSGEINVTGLAGNAESMIAAGSETTATALTGLTWYLLHDRACLQQLTDEVRGAFAAPEHITAAATDKLPYLRACLQEALRVFPPVAFALPRDSPGAVIDGHFVPAGVCVGVENFAMHTDPRFWGEAEQFRPARWLAPGWPGDDRRAWQPFSLGPRACLGMNLAWMEMRIALAKLVWHFDLEMACDIAEWNAVVEQTILWKKPALFVKFHPRKVPAE